MIYSRRRKINHRFLEVKEPDPQHRWGNEIGIFGLSRGDKFKLKKMDSSDGILDCHVKVDALPQSIKSSYRELHASDDRLSIQICRLGPPREGKHCFMGVVLLGKKAETEYEAYAEVDFEEGEGKLIFLKKFFN